MDVKLSDLVTLFDSKYQGKVLFSIPCNINFSNIIVIILIIFWSRSEAPEYLFIWQSTLSMPFRAVWFRFHRVGHRGIFFRFEINRNWSCQLKRKPIHQPKYKLSNFLCRSTISIILTNYWKKISCGRLCCIIYQPVISIKRQLI
jgi:hypothetical protein